MNHLINPIKHVYEWDRVTIGNNLDAILHAYKTESYFINNDKFAYLLYDQLPFDIEIPPDLEFKKGHLLEWLFGEVAFYLSLEGRMPFSTYVNAITLYPDNNELIVNLTRYRNITIKYKQLRIFNFDNIEGFPHEISYGVDKYRVYDWFKIEKLSKNFKFEEIKDAHNDFVERIVLFKEDDHKERDYDHIISMSSIDFHKIEDLNYSSNMSRLKTLDMLEKQNYKSITVDNCEFLKRERLLELILEYGKYDNIEIGGTWKE